jgi:hypothetical protein
MKLQLAGWEKRRTFWQLPDVIDWAHVGLSGFRGEGGEQA